MGLPPGYLPRAGDILVLHATVKYDFDPGDNHVGMKIGYNSISLPLEKIGGLKRRTWNEGESVKHRSISRWYGTVVATSEDVVWIRLDPAADQRGAASGTRIFHANELLYNKIEPDVPDEMLPETAAVSQENSYQGTDEPAALIDPDAEHGAADV